MRLEVHSYRENSTKLNLVARSTARE